MIPYETLTLILSVESLDPESYVLKKKHITMGTHNWEELMLTPLYNQTLATCQHFPFYRSNVR